MQDELWTKFNELVAKCHQQCCMVINKVLVAPVGPGALPQWEQEHMNAQLSWPRLRISCLSNIHSAIVQNINQLSPSLLQRRFEEQVLYSPVDRLFVVATVLQLL